MTDAGVAEGMDAFAALGEPVRSALSDRGFTTPTEPQRRAIPPLVDGDHGLVVAPTGTGKTETAMLPVFDALAADPPDGMGALYVTPLRALNRDMRERLEWWGETLELDVQVRHGDTSDYQRQRQAEDPPDVLVTTPETLQAMLTGSKLRTALADVRHLVIDEVHELAASKRGAQLTVAMERLRALADDYQRIGLSATVGDPAEVGRFLTGARGCTIVEIDAGSDVAFDVVSPEVTEADEALAGELATDAEIASHVRLIRDLVADHESTLIFVNTRQTAEALGSRFKALDEPIEVHHGSLSKEARIDVEDRFKDGEIDGLVCTSSMELGIDVGRVDHVVQYNSPREVTRLLQRVGRAGHRRDEVSTGTIVTDHPDDTLEALAIARRAVAGEVETAGIHHGSLDVVANQVVGIVMDREDGVDARAAYELVTDAYPFRELAPAQFREVVRELDGNRVVWLDEERDRIETSGGTWQYFYRNLSMIPDEETYEVYDISARRQVGTLDERFVVNFAEPGEAFIQRGEMWRINDVDDEEARVNVAPIEDPAGEVPSWTGQEIPVPAGVANEVGEMRSVAAPQFERGAATETVAREFTARYPTDEHTAAVGLEQIQRHAAAGAPVPTANRLVVEGRGREIVVNSPYGHEVNRTLGRLLSALIGQRTGSSVGMEADPYRVELEVPSRTDPGTVIEILEETDPNHVEGLLELALKNSDTLKFTLAHVAAKFGALKRYDADRRFGGDRLLAALEDTPVFDEAVREVFHTELATAETAALLERIQSGDVDVAAARDHTPIGTGGRSSGRELLVPENADASVIETLKDRVLSDRVILLCVHCTEWRSERTVGSVSDEPTCPACGSTRIAALNPWDDETVAAVRADEKDDEQHRRTQRAHRAANLVQAHGQQAVIALAARGVGPTNAARVIGKLREDEDEFYRDLLEQERQYARTQQFW
ncbi:DEAD/DEAH box helicase [Halobaculum sp. MBLA0147]|uniref:DEAD/DEAH box helicase n=1 Tax=Halobaculum sp. MBLA0147 TaxID=3079934 RepID=UPI00352450D1